MKLYDTLSRKIKPIQPIKYPVVTVYTCGPTVYDFPHIGNWFTFIRYDLLIRTLKTSGLSPLWVMNITDVGHLVGDNDDGEDKLEKGARREQKTAWDIASYYTKYFIAGLERLNITQTSYLPKATEHIAEQISLIQELEAKGYTYVMSDGVYYDTAKFSRYADFARLDLDEQEAGARVEYNPEKHNASDFALWKFSPTDRKRDMEWDSPWGKGFPGWHLECSAMSMKYLGETLDIHAGGIDHVPVHHSNEIAQSEAVTDKPLAHVWMHTNHISIEGEKISKSLGNGLTLEDIETHDISLDAFRLFVLESHYRSQSKFSWTGLESAQRRLNYLHEAVSLVYQPVVHDHSRNDVAGVGDTNCTHRPVQAEEFETNFQTLLEHLKTDLNTPQALSDLNGMLDDVSRRRITVTEVDAFREYLRKVDDLLGTQLLSLNDISADNKVLVMRRQEAREAKDWVTADRLRDELASNHIGVRDTEYGSAWYLLC
jgi:cysteinyl-tRNA synthetase